MKNIARIITLTAALAIAGSLQAVELNTEKQKYSYANGFVIASQFKASGVTDVDLQAFMAAMQDVMQEKPLQMELADMQKALEYQRQLVMESKKNAASESGRRFMQENRQVDGVKELASGLQYRVLKSGDGAMPSADDEVEVHYHGTLTDGTVFDSSVERGEPASFPLKGVIPGFREAITRMPVGSKWQVVLPPELGYGEAGAPPRIGPNETLIFEIELLAIK